jgi:hypothetical protein
MNTPARMSGFCSTICYRVAPPLPRMAQNAVDAANPYWDFSLDTDSGSAFNTGLADYSNASSLDL